MIILIIFTYFEIRFLKIYFILIYMHVFCVWFYVYEQSSCEGQKRVLEPMELELQEIVSNQTGSSEPNLCYVQEQELLLTTDPSLQCQTTTTTKTTTTITIIKMIMMINNNNFLILSFIPSNCLSS